VVKTVQHRNNRNVPERDCASGARGKLRCAGPYFVAGKTRRDLLRQVRQLAAAELRSSHGYPRCAATEDLAVNQFSVKEAQAHALVPAAGNTDAGYRKAWSRGESPQRRIVSPESEPSDSKSVPVLSALVSHRFGARSKLPR